MADIELLVDGMLSGTGIRDALNGGYIKPDKLGLSNQLSERLVQWLAKYEEAHFFDYKDNTKIKELDAEGIRIARALKSEVPNAYVGYFSSAEMKRSAI